MRARGHAPSTQHPAAHTHLGDAPQLPRRLVRVCHGHHDALRVRPLSHNVCHELREEEGGRLAANFGDKGKSERALHMAARMQLSSARPASQRSNTALPADQDQPVAAAHLQRLLCLAAAVQRVTLERPHLQAGTVQQSGATGGSRKWAKQGRRLQALAKLAAGVSQAESRPARYKTAREYMWGKTCHTATPRTSWSPLCFFSTPSASLAACCTQSGRPVQAAAEGRLGRMMPQITVKLVGPAEHQWQLRQLPLDASHNPTPSRAVHGVPHCSQPWSPSKSGHPGHRRLAAACARTAPRQRVPLRQCVRLTVVSCPCDRCLQAAAAAAS